MKKLEIYTDGSHNPDKQSGGWSFIIVEDEKILIQKSGIELETTNNRCEMTAAIRSMQELGSIDFDKKNIILYSDSAYLVNAFKDGWISTWQGNGWINSERQPVKNKDLWENVILLKEKYNVDFIHIRRRSNDFARMVDDMAN